MGMEFLLLLWISYWYSEFQRGFGKDSVVIDNFVHVTQPCIGRLFTRGAIMLPIVNLRVTGLEGTWACSVNVTQLVI